MIHSTTRSKPLDELLTLLADQHRRSIVVYFRDSSNDHATLQELATHVSERHDEDPERITTRLHHAKLPRLADAGVLEYDSRSKTIRYPGNDDVEALVGRLEELSR